MHLTGGILRHFQVFSTPKQNPALGVLSTPARQQVKQTVIIANTFQEANVFKRKNSMYQFANYIITLRRESLYGLRNYIAIFYNHPQWVDREVLDIIERNAFEVKIVKI